MKTADDTAVNIHNFVHQRCVACGNANVKGLHLRFDTSIDGSVKGKFQCSEIFEGYSGILHGGIISLILDSAMGNCMFARGLATVTVEMTTKYKHPVVTKQDATVSAKITRVSHPLYLLEAEIVQDGKVKAIATGKYYDQPKLIDSSKVDL